MDPHPFLTSLASRLVADDLATAVACAVSDGSKAYCGFGGTLTLDSEDRVGSATWFDLASLTKPFVATAALVSSAQGKLPLDIPLGDVVEGLEGGIAEEPLDSLWRHRAGLIPWFPFYRGEAPPASSQFADPALWDRIPDPEDDGVYSDLGPILWSRLALERDLDLESTLRQISDCSPSFQLPSGVAVAATYQSNQRERYLAQELGLAVEAETGPFQGVAQDGNARFLEISGHAGLFGTVETALELGLAWLHPDSSGPAALTREVVERCTQGKGRYAFGWWRADRELEGLAEGSFGHNGFTGGSIWVAPEADRVMVLLAHRKAQSDTLATVRRRFHEWALDIPFS